MSTRYPGGLITKTPVVPTSSAAPGVWTLEQALENIKAGTWPVTNDPYFNYVTALLHFDGTNGAQNNTFLDSSTSALSITRNGNTTQGSFSPFSHSNGYWSNYFDGSGDYLSTSNSSSEFTFGTSDFTVEFWLFSYDVSSSTQRGCLQTSATAGGLSTGYTTGIVIFQGANSSGGALTGGLSVNVGGTSLGSTSAVIAANTWYHIALVRSSGTSTLYVNGTSVGSASTTANLTATYAAVGGYYNGSYLLNGYISNLRMVKGTAVYTSNFTPPTIPLTAIANTALLTCQSNRFIDNSTNAFAITVNGNPSVQVFNPLSPTEAYSTTSNGGSGYFDGSGDYLDTAASSALSLTGQFTVECWYFQTAVATYPTVFELNAYTDGILFRPAAGSQGGVWVNGSQIVTGVTESIGRWNHFAITRNASNSTSVYINGARVYNGTISGTINSANGYLRIGTSTHTSGQHHTGYISDMRVVKGSAVYDPTQTTITLPTAPLTAITNTTFLCNFTNAGIFDNSASSNFETLNQAQLNTTTKKFGTASMACDGSYDGAIVYPTSPNYGFGLGDFTIEGWFYINASVTARQPFIKIGTGSTSVLQVLKTDGGFSYVLGYLINSSAGIGWFPGYVPATETWNHIAVSRQGTNMRFFLNGVLAGTVTGSNDLGTANGLVIGYDENSSLGDRSLNGYADEVRITKGYARYTAAFTPPVAPFANK